ncbi:MAG: hypothetical protein ACOZCE_07785 [Spirochaetota bacterium]|jgi:hypothetical protein
MGREAAQLSPLIPVFGHGQKAIKSDDYIIRRGIFFNVNIHDGYDHNHNFEKPLRYCPVKVYWQAEAGLKE